MQSSTAIAFRALVMLILLISVPLIAIFGSDLPAVLRKFVEGKLALRLEESPASGEPAAAAVENPVAATANPFSEAAPYRSDSSASPAGAASSNDPSQMRAGPLEPRSFPPVNGTPPTGSAVQPPVQPAGGLAATTPATGLGTNWPPSSNPLNSPNDPSTAPHSPPDAFAVPSDSRPIPSPGHGATPATGINPAGPAEAGGNAGLKDNPLSASTSDSTAAPGDARIRQAEQRLRELGATQYILETWGPQNKRYRFSCRMAVNGNAGVNRHFELIDDDPWRAMEGVLNQVERWHAEASQ